MSDIKFLKQKANQIRKDLIKVIFDSGSGHIGGSLSITDILTVLYYEIMDISPENFRSKSRDHFILSKGHSVESYWCVLADKGFFPKEELKSYCKFGSLLIGHPNNKVFGVEMNTGSLGHGLSISVGMAISGKMDLEKYRVFTLLGDGELAEGSVWEAAMSAAHYKLDNLVAIVDRNKLQISGETKDVMDLEPLSSKWNSFGWKVISVNGNNIQELIEVFSNIPAEKNKPTVIIANTTKGKGVSFIENKAGWHHHVPNKIEYNMAMEELNLAGEALKNE